MQQNNTQKSNNRGDASNKCFGEFVRFISEKVIKKFGASYETQSELRNSWRDKYEYRAETEKYLIRKTKLFIETLDSKAAKNYDLGFLHAVVRKMADYLSRYTKRKRPDMLRREAIKDLERELWDNNPYIKGISARQETNRFARKSPKYAQKKRKEERREKAKYDKKIAEQVRYVFIEASFYRGK